jgi:thioredoxin 1
MKSIFICLLFCTIICYGSSLNAKDEIGTKYLKDSLKKSKQEGKDLLVVFGADWCEWCSILKNDLSEMKLENIDVILFDIDDANNKELIKKLKIKPIPDSILFRNFKQIKRKVGYKNSEDFIDWLSE